MAHSPSLCRGADGRGVMESLGIKAGGEGQENTCAPELSARSPCCYCAGVHRSRGGTGGGREACAHQNAELILNIPCSMPRAGGQAGCPGCSKDGEGCCHRARQGSQKAGQGGAQVTAVGMGLTQCAGCVFDVLSHGAAAAARGSTSLYHLVKSTSLASLPSLSLSQSQIRIRKSSDNVPSHSSCRVHPLRSTHD